MIIREVSRVISHKPTFIDNLQPGLFLYFSLHTGEGEKRTPDTLTPQVACCLLTSTMMLSYVMQ